jgi:hypothetical protein
MALPSSEGAKTAHPDSGAEASRGNRYAAFTKI